VVIDKIIFHKRVIALKPSFATKHKRSWHWLQFEKELKYPGEVVTDFKLNLLQK
jgi:hypothetical protein